MMVTLARTNDEGRVTFTDVAPRSYRVRVTRVGYQPIEDQLAVGLADTTVALVMRPTPARLAEVRVIASRPTGVFGKVGQASDWTPIPGATVVVYGGRTMRTDSTGSFDAPELRAGAHLIRVEREGFVARMRSVTVPPSGAVEVSILLEPGRTSPLQEGLLSELGQRQRWRGNQSALISREELPRGGDPTLSVALRGSRPVNRKGLVITGTACVFVNGEPKPGLPLDAFTVDQVEAVEVYAARSEMSGTLAKRWPSGMPCTSGSATGALSARPQTPRPGTVTMVVIWLKPDSNR
jgi:hypothetical protein